MYKKLSVIHLVHTLIIIYWAFLYRRSRLISEGGGLNLLAILLFASLYVYLYGALSYGSDFDYRNLACLVGSFLPLAILLRKNRTPWVILLGISLAGTSLYLFKNRHKGRLKTFSLLPLSKRATQTFTLVLLLFFMVLVYLLNLETSLVLIFIQLIFWVCELWLILYLREKENTYEKVYQMYYLSDYLTQERNDFARLIHDELIQDLYAAKNLLSMKSPDLPYTKEVLTTLETRAREIMNFYQSHIFENMDLEANLLGIFQSVGALYPQKGLDINYKIQGRLAQNLDKARMRLVCILTKELVNNIYKHSQGTYLSYEINQVGQDLWITLESDGAGLKDLEAIKESKRGVLLMKMLVKTQSGQMEYTLNGSILSTQIQLKGGMDERIIT